MAYGKRTRSTSRYTVTKRRRYNPPSVAARRLRKRKASAGVLGVHYKPWTPGRTTRTVRYGPEVHVVELTHGQGTVPVAGGFHHINDISLNNTISGRNGQSCRMLNLELNYRLSNVNDHTSVGYLAIVYDRSPRGALPFPNEPFKINHGLVLPNFHTRERFEILWQKHFDLEGDAAHATTATVPTASSIQQENLVIPINRPVKFTDTSIDGTIDFVQAGALYLFHIGSTSGTTADGTPHLDYQRRLTFLP